MKSRLLKVIIGLSLLLGTGYLAFANDGDPPPLCVPPFCTGK